MNRSMSPSDEERTELQTQLTRLIGAGRMQIAEYDRIMEVVWSTEDRSVFERIRFQHLGHQGPTPPNYSQQQPQAPQTPIHYQQPHPGQMPPHSQPMAQPGTEMGPLVPATPGGQPTSSNFGSIVRRGQWTAAAHTTFKINGASLHLDLRQAHAAAPVVTFHITANMSTIEIIVPPGVYVDNRIQETLSSSDIQVTAPAPGAPRIVLTGVARASEIKVKTKVIEERGSLWRKFFGSH